jgi:isoquinoline 1-oxidoreductase alpha subunit
MALCGACTVLQNGKAIRSCSKQMSTVDGLDITTIEGVTVNGPHAVQKAWAEVSVPQCGYCQPGQIMQAVSLLATKPNPTDADIDDGMTGNICRCGTYQRIRAAIHEAAKETA